MKNKKVTLIVIIVLLAINIPLTILGFIFKAPAVENQNPNHEMFLDGYIWFYNENDEYLSRYQCQTNICELTKGSIDDSTFDIDFYSGGTSLSTSVIDMKYAFITDGSEIHLYDIVKGEILSSYVSLKNYNVETINNIFILETNDEMYGVVSFVDGFKTVVPFEYDFIGVSDRLTIDGYLNTEKYIVKKDATWYVVDNTNDALTVTFNNPIVYNNDNIVITKTNEIFEVYSFEGTRYLENFAIKQYYMEDKYMIYVTDNYIFVFDNMDSNPIKNISLTNSSRDIKVERHDNLVDIYLDDSVVETLEI